MDKEILGILSEIEEDVDFSQSSDFFKDKLLASIDVLSLVVELESCFKVAIPASEIIPDNFRNVSAISNLIERLQNK